MYNLTAKILILAATLLNIFAVLAFINGLRINVNDSLYNFPELGFVSAIIDGSIFSLSVIVNIILIPVGFLYWRHLEKNSRKGKHNSYAIVSGIFMLLLSFVAYYLN